MNRVYDSYVSSGVTNVTSGIDVKRVLAVERHREREAWTNRTVLLSRSMLEAITRYLYDMCVKFKLHTSTLFSAMDMFIRVCDRFTHDNPTLSKVSIMCLLVSCKYEEKELDTPSFTHFYCSKNNVFSCLAEMVKYEKLILEMLKWRINSVNVTHHLELLSSIGIITNTDTREGLKMFPSVAKDSIRYIDFFTRLSMIESDFFFYPPSIVAAAITAAARKALHISDVWSEEMVDLCGYSEAAFRSCFDQLWGLYCDKYAQHKDYHEVSPTNPHLIRSSVMAY